MKFDDLIFDASGQSQQLLGNITPYEESVFGDVPEHFVWVRRMRHYPVIAKQKVLDPDEAKSVNLDGVFLYWIVGEDGQIFSSAVREDSVNLLLEARQTRPASEPLPTNRLSRDAEENDEDYNRRTNHGQF